MNTLNTIEALKALYVALGGQAADVANLNITPEMISAIADVVEGGGGSSLPEVTSDDNGKLLTVVEGGWNKADAPKELPALESGTTDNGKILRASNGQWVKGNYIVPKKIFTYVVDATDPSSPQVTDNPEFNIVASAVDSGSVAVGKVEALGMEIYLSEVVVMRAEETEEISSVTFCGIGMLGSSPVYISVSQTAEGEGCSADIIPLAVASS